uniref:TERF1-interacting nuclear factor 2 N-terminal domain-containing protein n=1 Tax=Calidris pygmaea TaxID=425635 RepID=A0A8C3PRZ0_9CHAR
GAVGLWAGPGVSLRLSLAGAWHVVRGRSLGQFPRVLGLLEALGRAAPGALRFRHAARLRLGLQAAVTILLGWPIPAAILPPSPGRWWCGCCRRPSPRGRSSTPSTPSSPRGRRRRPAATARP